MSGRARAGLITGLLALTAGLGAAPATAAPPGLGFVPSLGGSSPGSACGGSVLCVGPGGTHGTIGAAVAAAPDGATIQVKAGTYNEKLTLNSKSVTLLGGFPASGFDSRNPATNPTTINAGRSGSVITVTGPGKVLIDGFVITGGKGPVDEYGGGGGSGIYVIDAGQVTIANNVIQGNDDERAWDCCQPEGGGIKVERSGAATIAGNIIRGNRSNRGGAIAFFGDGAIRGNLVEDNHGVGDHGGGIYMSGADISVTGNLVRGNTIGSGAGYGWGGGGLIFANPDGDTVHGLFRHNRWVANSAPTIGSGFFADEGATATLFGELFHDNSCPDLGGAGIYVDGGEGGSGVNRGSRAKIENVTVTGHGCNGGVGNGLLAEQGSSVEVLNSIFWANGGSSEIIVCANQNLPCTYGTDPDPKPSSVRYSLVGGKVQGVNPGTGVISANPLFVSPGADDYHLGAGSPAINAGDPASPVLAEPEPNGARRNLGAYGGSAEAATGTGGPPIAKLTLVKVKVKGFKVKRRVIKGKLATARNCRVGRKVKLIRGKRSLATTRANKQGKFKFKLKGKLARKLSRGGRVHLLVPRKQVGELVCKPIKTKPRRV